MNISEYEGGEIINCLESRAILVDTRRRVKSRHVTSCYLESSAKASSLVAEPFAPAVCSNAAMPDERGGCGRVCGCVCGGGG